MSDRHPAQPARSTWWSRLTRPFWVVPAAIATASVLLGVIGPYVEALLPEVLRLFHGGPEGARAVLSTIATAMISVTGLVFSVTMVVLQLASSQFTPRVLGDFLERRVVQVTLGVFTGTFLYSLTVLRGVTDAVVPQTSVTLAFAFVLASVGLFLAFIHTIINSVRVQQVIRDVGRRTCAEIDPDPAIRPGGWSPRPGTARRPVAWAGAPGYVRGIEVSRLLAWAEKHDAVVEVLPRVGDFVVTGQEYARVWGGDDQVEDPPALVDVAVERAVRRDPEFGVRQLVDIAERALSPGINDPTTAVQVVDELHVVLRRVVAAPAPSAYLHAESGEVRGLMHQRELGDLLDTVVGELTHYGRDAPRVVPRLREMLDDLLAAARPEHRAVVERHRDALGPEGGPVGVGDA